MTALRRRIVLSGGAIALGVTVGARLVAAGGKTNAAAVERGRYLVERVAMCQECHTPRDAEGNFDRANWLRGGPHQYCSVRPRPDWADAAPAIAGLPGWLRDEDAIHFLETGERPDGSRPRPPMKAYHMNHADAAAVVAYLRSLGAAPAPPR